MWHAGSGIAVAALLCRLIVFFPSAAVAAAAEAPAVACRDFTRVPLAPATERHDAHSVERFAQIIAEEKSRPPQVLFLGDSLTERWTPEIWRRDIAPLGAVNAGVDGDRTEHLLWRIENGNLPEPPPRVIVLLIGTNDLGHGRSPKTAAEGVRHDLQRLRERASSARILLLGLTPRTDRFGRLVDAVNAEIRTCAGGAVTYADLGQSLRDAGGVAPGVIADGVHLTPSGYQRLTGELRRHLDLLLAR